LECGRPAPVNGFLQIVDNLPLRALIGYMNALLHPTIALLQSSSLATVVQQEIERAILSGEHPPGSKLTEAALAERMGVSRGPVLSHARRGRAAAHREEPRRVRARHSDRRGR
jgi:hypothetical protein